VQGGPAQRHRHRLHHPVGPLGPLPVLDEGLLDLADDAVRENAVVAGLHDPHQPGARVALRPALALDERLARLVLLELPAVLDEPSDAQHPAVKARVVKFVELVTEPTTAREVLASMGLPTDLPPMAKARSPDFYKSCSPPTRTERQAAAR